MPAAADESAYLAGLRTIAESGLTDAGRLLAYYDGDWAGDVRQVFRTNRF